MNIKNSLLAIFVVFCWALNLLAVRFSIIEIPVFVLTGSRFLLVSLCILPFVKIPKGRLIQIFGLSLILGIGHFASFFYGMNFIGAGLTSIILNLQSPLGLILAAFFLKEKIPLIRWLGVMLAFIGVIILFADPEASSNIKGVFFVFIGALMWSAANIYIKKYLGGSINFQTLGWMSFFSGIVLSLLGLVCGSDFSTLLNASPTALSGLAYTVFVSTIIAYGIWFYLLRSVELNLLSPFPLMIPVFGLLLGNIFAGEIISKERVLGALLVIAGVAISLFVQRNKQTELTPD